MSNELDLVAQNGTALATSKPAFSLKSLNLAEKCPAVVVASTGSKLSKYPFPKLKFEEGRRCRLAILTEDVIMLKTHYHPEIGSIICDGGACCKHCDRVSIKYCYPCVVYDTDTAGRIVSPRIEPKLLVLGSEMYDQISLLSEIGGSITGMDLLFSCTSTQYQKCQVTQAGTAQWSASESNIKYITEYLTMNGEHMLDTLGRTYTSEEITEKLSEANAPVQEQKFISADALADAYRV